MCIAFPGRVVSIDDDNFAIIEIENIKRRVCLDIVDEDVVVGDYVICHAGYAMHKIDTELAREKLAMLKEILENGIY